jgi:hypothetical protein
MALHTKQAVLKASLVEVRSAVTCGGGSGAVNPCGGGGSPLDKERRLHHTQLTLQQLLHEQDKAKDSDASRKRVQQLEGLLAEEQAERKKTDTQLKAVQRESARWQREQQRIWHDTKASLLKQLEASDQALATMVNKF